MYDVTYMWNLKKYEILVSITKKKLTHIFIEQTTVYQSSEQKRREK